MFEVGMDMKLAAAETSGKRQLVLLQQDAGLFSRICDVPHASAWAKLLLHYQQ